MTLFDNILLAINAIRGNMLRTVLTFLIIAFGIMALVGILTAVDGITTSLSSSFATMGANNFDIRKKGTGIRVGRRGRKAKNYTAISIDEAIEFKSRFKYPATVSISTIGEFAATIKSNTAKTNPNIRVMAGDENYLAIGSFDLAHGRNFTELEAQNGRNIVILGKSIAEKLFSKPEKSLEQLITISGKSYKVVGVLGSKEATSIFSSDNMCIIPLMKGRMVYGNSTTTYVTTVMLKNPATIDDASAEAIGLMRAIRKQRFNEEDNFDLSRSDKLSTMLIEQSSYITSAATLIGIITLLGGAIGLMNIMLVSVTERTHEIGITKALGATRNVILTQFLVEAIVICQIGGLLGIVLGILAGNGVSFLINGPFIIPWLWIIGGVVLCLFVGLVSGIYPALKAASVDPMESLRHE